MTDSWEEIKQRYDNSVMQLMVVSANYNSMRPYLGPHDVESSGSGFIIDAEKGLVLTNAHVVENAMSITGRLPKLGRKDIKLTLGSISRSKDLALCTIDKKDLKHVLEGNDPKSMTMDLGDSMKTSQTNKVLAIGYPLGERSIKFTEGIVSGFHNGDDSEFSASVTEDSHLRDPTYIQVTAPLNPGVSGGPLVNAKGQVIGINAAGRMFAQNIGYAIPIRTFLANYKEMLNEPLIKIPTFSLRWEGINDDISEFKAGKNNVQGIMVRKTLPDSILNKLENGDIISQMCFKDPFWNEDTISLQKFRDTPDNSGITVTAYFDRYGDVLICKGCNSDDKLGKEVKKCESMIGRKLSLAEFSDIIPINSIIKVVFNRDGAWKKLETKFKNVESNRKLPIYPRFQPLDYEIIGGLCITPLLVNQMARLPKFRTLMENNSTDKFMFKNHLLICQVFPDTNVYKTNSVSEGDILTKVNGKEVSTLQELRDLVDKKNKFITFETDDGALFAINKEKLAEDEMITESMIN